MSGTRWRRWGLAAGAALVATTGLVLVAEPALAVPGRVVVTVTTATDSVSPKGNVVTCPAGTVPIGGGGAINSASQSLKVVQDNPSATGWVFAAVEDSFGFAGTWSLTMWAVCAPAPAGWELITSASVPVNPSGTAMATCTLGRRVIAAGALVGMPTTDGNAVLEAVRPNSNLTAVAARGAIDATMAGLPTSTIKAYAICVNLLPGHQLVVASSPSNSSDKSVTATCPSGTLIENVGANLRSSSGTVNLATLRPGGATGVVIAREHSPGVTGNWSVEAFAICAQ